MFFFIPLGTTRPRLRVPYFTYGLMIANVAVFVAQAASQEPFRWAFVPAHPSPFTWLAAIFMHVDLLHLGGNMLFLWLFGTLTEDAFGPWVFLGVYFGGGLVAAAVDAAVAAVWAPGSLEIPRLGASGAIAGIMGLSAVCFVRAKVRVWYIAYYVLRGGSGIAEVAAPLFVALWVIWEVVQGLVGTYVEANFGSAGGTAHWAHVGGFVVGVGAALALHLPRRVVRGDVISGREAPSDRMGGYVQLGDAEQLARDEPDSADAWHALGRAREEAGLGSKAEEAYTRAMTLFLRDGRLPEAVRSYRGAAAYGGPLACSPDAVFDLACALEESGHADDARHAFLEAAARAPRQPMAETALLRAGELAQDHLRDYDAASECYNRLLRDHPRSEWADLCRQRLQQLAARQRGEPGGEDTIHYTKA